MSFVNMHYSHSFLVLARRPTHSFIEKNAKTLLILIEFTKGQYFGSRIEFLENLVSAIYKGQIYLLFYDDYIQMGN